MPKENRYIPSELLTNKENDTLMKLHPTEWENRATAVVELYLTSGPRHNKWKLAMCGVACFIKDHTHRSYYIRIFVLPACVVEFEQELYSEFLYKKSRDFLHTFESDQCMAALNFASVDEAHTFYTVVQQVIRMRKERRSTRRSHLSSEGSFSDRSSISKSTPNLAEQASTKNWFTSTIQINRPTKEKTGNKKAKKKGKRAKSEKILKSAPRLTKADIGRPEDFKHIKHIGFDINSGFEMNFNEKDFQDFFEMAGVTQKELRDPNTRRFIYEFIDKNGIYDVSKEKPLPPLKPTIDCRSMEEPHIRPLKRAPSRIAPPAPRAAAARRPPCSPPPTPPRDHAKPCKEDKGSCTAPPAIHLNTGSIPPPPPPPLPQSSPKPPPLSEIVSCPKPPPPPPRQEHYASPSDDDSGDIASDNNNEVEEPKVMTDARQDLLSGIRKGVILKKVEEASPSPKPAQKMNDMAGALARALEERSKVIHSSDSSDSDCYSSFDDDDWDD